MQVESEPARNGGARRSRARRRELNASQQAVLLDEAVDSAAAAMQQLTCENRCERDEYRNMFEPSTAISNAVPASPNRQWTQRWCCKYLCACPHALAFAVQIFGLLSVHFH